jgi:hypothetical protein
MKGYEKYDDGCEYDKAPKPAFIEQPPFIVLSPRPDWQGFFGDHSLFARSGA